MARLLSMISKCLILMIRVYQYSFSLLIHSCCRFDPTCSQYSIHVIKKFGLIKGFYLMFKRILTCHPFRVNDYKIIVKKLADKRENK